MSLPSNIHSSATFVDNVPLRKSELDKNPFEQLKQWLNEAEESHFYTYPYAMNLATCNANGMPSSRIVLCKSLNDSGLVFYTNYNSSKGQDMLTNNQAAVSFYWQIFERQVRVTGTIEKVSEKESDEYFNSRPRGSKIGAWASQQSSVLKSSGELKNAFQKINNDFDENEIPRPPYWGGYTLKPKTFEFWQANENRLHDRIRYTKQSSGEFLMDRLAP